MERMEELETTMAEKFAKMESMIRGSQAKNDGNCAPSPHVEVHTTSAVEGQNIIQDVKCIIDYGDVSKLIGKRVLLVDIEMQHVADGILVSTEIENVVMGRKIGTECCEVSITHAQRPNTSVFVKDQFRKRFWSIHDAAWKSSGFSHGASIYRGVTRHHQHGRWQERIGRVAEKKDVYLGTFKYWNGRENKSFSRACGIKMSGYGFEFYFSYVDVSVSALYVYIRYGQVLFSIVFQNLIEGRTSVAVDRCSGAIDSYCFNSFIQNLSFIRRSRMTWSMNNKRRMVVELPLDLSLTVLKCIHPSVDMLCKLIKSSVDMLGDGCLELKHLICQKFSQVFRDCRLRSMLSVLLRGELSDIFITTRDIHVFLGFTYSDWNSNKGEYGSDGTSIGHCPFGIGVALINEVKHEVGQVDLLTLKEEVEETFMDFGDKFSTTILGSDEGTEDVMDHPMEWWNGVGINIYKGFAGVIGLLGNYGVILRGIEMELRDCRGGILLLGLQKGNLNLCSKERFNAFEHILQGREVHIAGLHNLLEDTANLAELQIWGTLSSRLRLA
ncbi:hypothetical protein Taro_039439 [Colocasia esculenta]|uniref:Uncharacterized protein n=1 Tax=Colocasia esculenta TaxID=4460 RepID=A0A843WVR9_COLES|nr:hypothetical protein [Colocasia esculenta]